LLTLPLDTNKVLLTLKTKRQMDYHSIKIFVVDDDVIFSKTLEHYLVNHGFSDLHLFESSQPMFARISEKPMVMILDHFLGLEIGLDVLKRVRAEHPTIHVFYLSSQDKAQIATRALKLGAIDYFEKNSRDLQKLVLAIEQKFELSHDIYLEGE
jgi:DNA-binding NtrC family response regulator